MNWLAGGGTRLGVVVFHFHHRPMPMALMAEYEDMFVADIQLSLSAPSAPSGMSLPAPRPPRRRSPWSATCCSSWPVSCRCPVVGLSSKSLWLRLLVLLRRWAASRGRCDNETCVASRMWRSSTSFEAAGQGGPFCLGSEAGSSEGGGGSLATTLQNKTKQNNITSSV